MANKYCGKLAYRGEGRIGTIREYYYSENSSGAKPTEKFVYRPLRSKQTLTTTTKPVIIESVKFAEANGAIFAAIKIKGQTYTGWSIKSPNDVRDNNFGKRLAIARAFGDTDAIADLLDEDFNDTYEEEYGDGEPSSEKAATSTNKIIAVSVPAGIVEDRRSTNDD